MHRFVVSFCVILVIISSFSSSVSGRPADVLVRNRRQSDQRLAELETLLALEKYRHRLRPDRKNESQPGYGVLDFNLIGRRKKSTRYLPGEPAHVFHRRSVSQTNNNFENRSPVAPADPILNENIDSLLSYKSLRVQDHNTSPHASNKIDFSEDKK